MEEKNTEVNAQPIHFLPYGVQLQNISAIEISAKKFRADVAKSQNAQLSIDLEEVEIDEESLQAQVVLHLQIDFTEEPRPYEISFKLLGHFTYIREYSVEIIQAFLQQGSLSVMLPFARELLLSLCTRLQVPALLLPMVQIAPPAFTVPDTEKASHE